MERKEFLRSLGAGAALVTGALACRCGVPWLNVAPGVTEGVRPGVFGSPAGAGGSLGHDGRPLCYRVRGGLLRRDVRVDLFRQL